MSQEGWNRDQETGCQQPDGPVRCVKNCGFFGSAATMNMCSKCYRDHVLQQTKEAGVKAAPAAKSSPLSSHMALPPRMDPMSVDIDKPIKEKSASDSDFMSGVHVLAGMAQVEEKAVPASPMVAEGLGYSGASSSAVSSSSTLLGTAVASPSSAATAADSSLDAASPGASKPNRCAACKKKVGLTGFKCRCNNVYCSSHRYSDKHNCTFDYKAAGRDAIAKANPVVRASKIEKI